MMHHIAPWALALLPTLAVAQNQAVTFVNGTGVDNSIDVPYGPGLLPTRGITVEAWVTYDDSTIPAGPTFHWPTIARHDVSPGGESWFLRVGAANTNNLNLEWAVSNGTSLSFATFAFAPGQFASWTHIAGTVDGQTLTLYVNGVQMGTSTFSGTIRDNQGLLRIGNGDTSAPGLENWNGAIDELRIWPFARTQAEIVSSMNDSLNLVPGGVTFNMNGSFNDSSSGFQGAAVGAAPFVMGAPIGPVIPLGGFPVGTATTNCSQALAIGAAGRTNSGNLDFAIMCYDGSPNTTGAVLFSFTTLATPIRIVGVDAWINPLGLISGPTVMSGGNGTTRVPFGLPPGFGGLNLSAQFIFIDPTCGNGNFTASPALGMAIQ